VSTSPAASPVDWSLKKPFPARLLHNRPLNGAGSAKDTRHLIISLAGSGLQYLPGDSLGVHAQNCPELVDRVLELLGASGDEAGTGADKQERSLREALLCHEISRVPKPLLRVLAERVDDAALAAMQGKDGRSELTEFCNGRDVVDVLERWPQHGLAPQELVGALRKLNPRLYSIASSLQAHPDEVHLTVGVVHFEAHGRLRKGVASTWLGHRVDADSPLPCYVHSSKSFKLPDDDDLPIIMVGPGTGIAPFRAFLEERRARGAQGRNWLFFGDQHRATDYLYAGEFEAMHADGLLQRIDLAFSRDQEHKVYVQHRMLEASAEIWAWLQEGGYFYVCGDATRMAKDVDQALHQIAVQEGGMDDDAAKDWIKKLRKDKRYQRDVYAV